jgi:ABC-type glycerol-3-phosphate transport system permease component
VEEPPFRRRERWNRHRGTRALLSRSAAIAAVGLFPFFYSWNDYFGPQIYASENPGAWTLSYGLQSFKSAHHTDWNLTMAATGW